MRFLQTTASLLATTLLMLGGRQAAATMPPLSQRPDPVTLSACQAWAAKQDADAIEMYGIQESGGSSRDLGLSRLTSDCMGDPVPDIVFAYSSAGALEIYCRKHSDSGICKKAQSRPDEVISALRILDLNDEDAVTELKAMALTGDLHAKLLAETWIVLSSIAVGEGRERCGFDGDQIIKAIWQPALDGMSADEVYELNRLVTSNFRNAERGRNLDIQKLYPISRAVVIYLTDRRGRWDCTKISDVWERSANYMVKRSK